MDYLPILKVKMNKENGLVNIPYMDPLGYIDCLVSGSISCTRWALLVINGVIAPTNGLING